MEFFAFLDYHERNETNKSYFFRSFTNQFPLYETLTEEVKTVGVKKSEFFKKTCKSGLSKKPLREKMFNSFQPDILTHRQQNS